jgi:hypothetical protein
VARWSAAKSLRDWELVQARDSPALLVARRRRNHLGAFLFVSWQSLAIAAELAEPVFILRLYGQKKKRLRNLACLRAGEK